ncbi:hypothetical protein D9M71_695460 [compost metagenome]
MMPSIALPVWRKNNWPKTSADAVPYRKNSYHSATAPAIAAATTRLMPAGAFSAVFAALTDAAVVGVAIVLHSDTYYWKKE